MKKHLLVIFHIFLALNLSANAVKKLSDFKDGHAYFDGASYELFSTSNTTLDIKDILSPKYQEQFKVPSNHEPDFDTRLDYWVRFTVDNDLKDERGDLLLTVYSHQTDEVDFFSPDKNSKDYIQRTLGANYEFDSRKYDDHFLIFDFPKLKGQETYYLKYRSHVPVNITFSVDSAKHFLKEHNAQYNMNFFIFGLTFMIILYNLYLYIVSKKFAFMFFVAYALSSAIYILDVDGLGFQYFWPTNPEFNKISFEISNGFMMTFALLLSTNMLRLYKNAKKLHFLHMVAIAVKIISLLMITNYLTDMVIDIVILTLPVISGFLLYKNNENAGRVYLTSSIILLIGYSVFVMRMNHIIIGPEWMYSAFKFTLVIQCIILSKALSEKYRRSLLQINNKKTVVKDPKMEEEIRELQSKIVSYKTKIQDQNSSLSSAQSELEGLKSEYVYLKVKLQELESDTALAAS